ncbi:MAG: hypothetical protein NTW21_12245 [Verrucomicrobia bacterium]|nr:hypothetical protein [Verrucomicrobiota bacterium]
MTEPREWELVDLELQEMPGLCLVASCQPDGSLRPRVVAQPKGAVAYAAAWCDKAGEVKEWFDLWVQDVGSWHLALNRQLMIIANPALDRHWLAWVKGLASTQPENFFHVGWEWQPGPVLWLSPDGRSRLQAETRWVLCTNDAILRKYRLASYTDSLHRYLWDQEETSPRFLATTPAAPEGPVTTALGAVFGHAIPINRDGALMALRRSYALPLGDFADALSNRASPPDIREALRNPVLGANAKLLDRAGLGHKSPGFFFTKNQISSHLCEVLHLKLAALHGVLVATKSAIQQTACPFLGLGVDSFGVSLSQAETALPFLWTHQVSLQSPPQCIRIEVGDVKEPCFMPHADLGRSVYRSPHAANEARGLARVRIRKVSEPDDQGLVVMEGTLLSEESIHAGRLDLLGLEWVLPRGGRLQLYAKIEGKTGEVAGEYRFCTLQTKLPQELREWLAGGRNTLSSDRVQFHLLPRVGTPCDLYSLGVIALRILLHNPEGHAAALDDLLSLTRLYRLRHSNGDWNTGTASLAEFVRTGEAGTLAENLSPHWMLVNGDMSSQDAFCEIPAPLWWATLDFISRLFPGEAADAFCKNHDDFQPRALQEVFAEPIAVLESLLGRTREMLFGNPSGNRELLNVIRQVRNST